MNTRIMVFPVQGNSALRARAEVTLILGDGQEIVMRDFRVIQKDGLTPWVAVPQVTYQKNGKAQYKDIIRLNQRAQSELSEKIISEYFARTNRS